MLDDARRAVVPEEVRSDGDICLLVTFERRNAILVVLCTRSDDRFPRHGDSKCVEEEANRC